MKKGIVILLLAVGLVAYTIYHNTDGTPTVQSAKASTAGAAKKEEKMAVGYLAPDFSLPGMDGKTYKLSDIHKPILLNFWASWCRPCRMESPRLEELYKKYNGKFEIVSVNSTIEDKETNARQFARKFGFTFPVLLDKKGDVGNLYQLQYYPTNIFISKTREIVKITSGLLPPAEMEDAVKQIIQ
ncbi:TlpA family protein disulfide reductase [Aneurinibacillus terranovensis]|uniref:TlpA family protein disulfide reductase n=1 Tax=Aneurinibacillus terranovensis TaxID=278991 RepID=UPI0003FDFCE4|nr:TlpA disulfide reductase family protein [Aneurinibacillus terranovensis]